MLSYNLILSIVQRNSAEILTHAAVNAGSNGGTIALGRGTANNTFLQMLGFGDVAKDLVYVLTNSNQTEQIKNAMIDSCKDKKRPFGILFTIQSQEFIKLGENNLNQNKMEKNMTENINSTHKLITIIVNRGFADDAMDAARKAGASGGTIINARGTAKEGEEKFFGIEIVPEKDMILILAENEKSEQIIKSVQNLSCLSKPGSGIVYTNPASNFTILGKPAK